MSSNLPKSSNKTKSVLSVSSSRHVSSANAAPSAAADSSQNVAKSSVRPSKQPTSALSVSSSKSDRSTRTSSGGGFCQQLHALLEKAFIVRKFNWGYTLYEVLGPILILWYSLTFISPHHNGDDHGTTTTSTTTMSNWFWDNYEEGNDTNIDTPRFTIDFGHKKDNDLVTEIYFTPMNEATNKLMSLLAKTHNISVGGVSKDEFHRRNDQLQASNMSKALTVFGIMFKDNFTSLNDPLSYKIYHQTDNAVMLDASTQMYPKKFDNQPALDFWPSYQAFAMVMTYINDGYVKLSVCAGKEVSKSSRCSLTKNPIDVYQMPYPPQPPTPKQSTMSPADKVAVAIVLSYLLVIPLLVKTITDEKANKSKELLSMMGMSDVCYYSSHFINFLLVMVFHALVMMVLLFWTSLSIFKSASPGLFFLAFLLFAVQSILMSFTISTFCTS